MRSFLFFLWLSWSFTVNGQVLQGYLPTATTTAGGNVSDVWQDSRGGWNNPAAHAWEQSLGFTASALQYWGLNELQQFGIAGHYTLNKVSGVGVQLQRFGNQDYSESNYGLSYGRQFNKILAIGLRFNAWNLNLGEYGQTTQYSADIGMQVKFHPQWAVSGQIQNPFAFVAEATELNAANLRSGLLYTSGEKVSIALELNKRLGQPLSIGTSLLYQPADALRIIIGSSTEPFRMHGGAEWLVANAFGFGLGSVYHPTLGWSPTASVRYQSLPVEKSGKKKKR